MYRVWSGYTKYLKSQVLDKQRIVQCPITGTYIPEKLYRQISKINNIANSPYSDDNDFINCDKLSMINGKELDRKSQAGLSVTQNIQNNINSKNNNEQSINCYYVPNIEFVDGLKLKYDEDAERFNLNPYFTVTHAIKKDLQVKLNLRIGFLRIINSKLTFENLTHQIFRLRKDIDQQSVTSCGSFTRSQRRQIFKNFALKNGFNSTQGGNDSQSVRTQSNQISTRTPQTYATSQTKPQTSHLSSTDSQGGNINSFINMSNPNPQNAFSQYGKLTYSQIQDINQKNGILIPGFPGMFANGVHTRFGKKVCFDSQSQAQSSGGPINDHLFQMSTKLNSRDLERQQEKIERDNKDRKDNQDFRINFFPFTHGEQIEQRRIQERGVMNEDLQRHLQGRSQRTSGSQPRHTKNSSNQWLIDEANQSTQFKNSLNGRVSTDYLTQYPHFLKPNKHYPYRRTDDSHIKSNMEVALDRYERDLVSQEQHKIQAKEQIKDQVLNETLTMRAIQARKQKEKQDTKKILEIQMDEKKRRDQSEIQRLREKVNTNYGPEETEEKHKYQIDKETQRKQQIEKELKQQMQSKSEKKRTQQDIERIEELQNLAAASQVLINERQDQVEKEKQQKQIYRKAWQQQMRIKDHEKLLYNELLTGEQFVKKL
eukprot:403345075